jgi:hypothetical protein
MDQAGMVAAHGKYLGDDVRMCFLAMSSMVTPAAQANSAARSRTRSRSGSVKSRIVEDPDLPRRK